MTPIESEADDYLEWMEIHNYAGDQSSAEVAISATSSPSPGNRRSTRRRK